MGAEHVNKKKIGSYINNYSGTYRSIESAYYLLMVFSETEMPYTETRGYYNKIFDIIIFPKHINNPEFFYTIHSGPENKLLQYNNMCYRLKL